jgi:hypothetical protein
MQNLLLEDAERQIRQLEARIAHQAAVAAELARHGFKGAAAEVLALLATLEGRLGRNRRNAASMRRNDAPAGRL